MSACRAMPGALLAMTVAMAGCAHPVPRTGSDDPALPAAPPVTAEAAILNGRLIDDMEAAGTVGSGPYRYRFVLLDVRSGEPAAHRPYALSNSDHRLPFVVEEKQVYQGITDGHGRTDAFAFDMPVAADSWRLRERFGAGPFGEQMQLVDAEDEPIAGMEYTLLVCDTAPRYHRGITDAGGNTGYAATAVAAPIILGLASEAVGDEDIDAEEDTARAREECQRHAEIAGSPAPL